MPWTVESPHPAKRRAVRLPRPRAGAAATGLFLAGLILSAATVPLVEPADATTAAHTTQAALTPPAR
ncbi:hypothetical protein PQI07_21945 [Methylobacterium sp. 092160098-2]|uniref:hypothetical protein n=1 Tax=Methylobacterium TaxID=407 RepID=UPI002381AD87|nr:hypothetical protein [Methylobacterium sp. 092160098-2]MDE4913345.1 hypothetical protein [Methylobacterium sp. 092160098-2]